MVSVRVACVVCVVGVPCLCVFSAFVESWFGSVVYTNRVPNGVVEVLLQYKLQLILSSKL